MHVTIRSHLLLLLNYIQLRHRISWIHLNSCILLFGMNLLKMILLNRGCCWCVTWWSLPNFHIVFLYSQNLTVNITYFPRFIFRIMSFLLIFLRFNCFLNIATWMYLYQFGGALWIQHSWRSTNFTLNRLHSREVRVVKVLFLLTEKEFLCLWSYS